MADKKLHSAGIFSDMTVDGPEIGTLVVIVDRAKNLPNRKSIGKQDPYCAARLGKEAKKTETDKRGGQTPRWDQEMRFTVHDSPDYYQLKVSVFNDDKKTDLIGETWVNLKEIIVEGGGKNDIWHNLQYRGKYAGEIRMEMTYYDSRPKPEKPKERTREGIPSNVEGGRDAAGGPRVMKERVKRRPLPVDPVTGERPAPPPAQTERIGPRELKPKVPVARASGETLPQPTPAQQPREYANGAQEYQQPEQPQQPQQRGYAPPPQEFAQPQQQQMPPSQQPSTYAHPDHSQRQPVQPQYSNPNYINQQSPLQQVEYQTSQNPRGQSQQVQGQYGQPPMQQSPAQQHYHTPSPLSIQTSSQSLNGQLPSNGYVVPPGLSQDNQQPRDLYSGGYDQYSQPQQNSYAQSNAQSVTPVRSNDPYSRRQNERGSEYETPPYKVPDFDSPPSPGGPPPPPPAHRIPPTSTAASSPGYGYAAQQTPTRDQFEHLRQNAHRQSLPSYGNPTYNASTPARQTYAPQPQQASPPKPAFVEPSYQDEMPRHRSFDERHMHQYNSMQPTVEDAPPTPAPYNLPTHRRSDEQIAPLQARYASNSRYEDIPAPAPLNLGRRPSAVSMNNGYQAGPPPPPSSSGYSNGTSYAANDVRQPDPYRGQQMPPPQQLSQRDDYNQPGYGQENYRSRSPAPEPQRWQQDEPGERPGSSGFMPSLPPTLVAGMDPAIALEISERIYSETRRQREARQAQQQPQQPGGYSRDAAQRYAESSQQSYGRPVSRGIDAPYGRPVSRGNDAPTDYRPVSRGRDSAYAQSAYGSQPTPIGRGSGTTYGAPHTIPRRGVSPAPSPIGSYNHTPSHQHTIHRKSVSPAPPPSRGSGDQPPERRLSAVPFGPDDYAALNPNAPKVAEAVQAVEDPDAKIIMHDGREVDPSDHLPEASWAALPPNLNVDGTGNREREKTRGSVSPAVQARMDRRESARPRSMADYGREREIPPPAAGRTRLVKKANRMSAQPASAGASPSSGHGYPNSYSANEYGSRSLPRARTFDVRDDRPNHDPYDREREVWGAAGRAPAPPPKIPLPHMHSAPVQGRPEPPQMGYSGVASGGRGSGGGMGGGGRDPNEEAWALLEEMKSIDLGSGTGRRRGRNA